MNSFKAILLAIVVGLAAAAGVYYWQQQKLNQLSTANKELTSAQQNLEKERDDAIKSAKAARNELAQSETDKTELIRLRGEVAPLRRQVKELDTLRAQNQQMKSTISQISSAAQAKPVPQEQPQDAQRQAVVAKMSDAKQMVMAMLLYANDNRGQLPADFNQTANYWNKNGNSFTGTNKFEVVLGGPLNAVANPTTTIAVREAEPITINGVRLKAYGFADGHAEIKREPPEGFDAWEKAHIQSPQ
jgi:outer membrane murein-binding lipoprotein Lpp